MKTKLSLKASSVAGEPRHAHNLPYNMTGDVLLSYVMETRWMQQVCTPRGKVGLKGRVHK